MGKAYSNVCMSLIAIQSCKSCLCLLMVVLWAPVLPPGNWG